VVSAPGKTGLAAAADLAGRPLVQLCTLETKQICRPLPPPTSRAPNRLMPGPSGSEPSG
jgi:hypothetical protein